MVTIEKLNQLKTNELSECIGGGGCGPLNVVDYLVVGLPGYFYCTGYDNKYREMQRNYGR